MLNYAKPAPTCPLSLGEPAHGLEEVIEAFAENPVKAENSPKVALCSPRPEGDVAADGSNFSIRLTPRKLQAVQ